MRNEKGQFIKGEYVGFGFKKKHEPWNKNKKGIHLSPQSEFKKGRVTWNKGIPMDIETKRKLSKSKKGKHFSKTTEFKNGRKTWNEGISYTALHQENHPYFTTGIRSYVKHATRNGKLPICENCGKSGTFGHKTHVHHIDKNRNNNHISNLKILCSKCHNNLHQNWKFRKLPKRKRVAYSPVMRGV